MEAEALTAAPQDAPEIGDSESPGMGQSFFPSTTQAVSEGGAWTAPKAALGAVTDVMSIPQRAAASAFGGQDFSDPNSYLGRETVENRWEGGAQPREEMYKPVKGQPAQTGMNMMIGGATNVPEEIARPAREFAVRTATDPLSYVGAIPKTLAGVGKTGTAVRQGSDKLAQELSGVSKEALTLGSTATGRKTLERASGRQAEIGNRITDALDDFHNNLPEKAVIEEALTKMGPVNIAPTLKALEDAKIKPRSNGGLLPAEQAANAEIDDILRGLRGNDGGKFPKTKLTASEAYDLRKGLDYETAFDKPGYKIANAAKLKARTQLKNDLLSASGRTGNPQYAQAMKDFHRKLQVRDKLFQKLGRTSNTRESTSEAFVKNLFGKNSAYKQQLVKDLDDILGEGFLQESKLTFLADELGDGGKAAWFPRQSTGRSAMAGSAAGLATSAGLGSGVGAATSLGLAAHASPAIASRYVMPTTRAIEKALNNGVFKSAQSKAAAKAYARTTNAATQAKLYKILQNELEEGEDE